MKRITLIVCLITVITAFTMSGCNTGKKSNQLTTPSKIELIVEPGEYWLVKWKLFIFKLNRTPQMAAWIENDQGNYISTIIVTNKNARKKWLKAPKEGRPEALPVWNHKMQNSTAQIDGVSAATSKGAVDVQIDDHSLINGQEYNVYLEINNSFDYNDFWTENNSGVNGQPSLIYHAKFIAGKSAEINLSPIGHGSVDGINGNIYQDLNGITTALNIIGKAYVNVN